VRQGKPFFEGKSQSRREARTTTHSIQSPTVFDNDSQFFNALPQNSRMQSGREEGAPLYLRLLEFVTTFSLAKKAVTGLKR